jgi:hypothetical protein
MSNDNLPVVSAQEPQTLSTVLGVTPKDMMKYALEISDTLTDVLRQRGMTQTFGQGEHVKSEGWQLAGSLLGFTAAEGPITELPDGSFEATVELRSIGSGRVLATASARCGSDEPTWRSKPKYARRSMAITRAIGRVYAQNFRWIIKLAGYETTPAEEMPEIIRDIVQEVPETYDAENVKHKTRLAAELNKLGVPRAGWADIHAAMHGKTLNELYAVVADYWKEHPVEA